MPITNIPAPRVSFIDERTGLMSREWYLFFLTLFNVTGIGQDVTPLPEQLATESVNLNVGPEVIDLSGEFAQSVQASQLAALQARFDAAVDAVGMEPRAELGTMASQNADRVRITGGTITGVAVGGYVVGPAGATNNNVALFDGATGLVIKDGGALGTMSAQNANSVTITGGTLTSVSLVTSALGTPSSGTLTNCTGTAAGLTAGAVALGGITGLGTNVATALAVNVGSAGAFVTFNGALGTPSSGTATNLTGTASGLTAGTVTTNANLTGDVTSVGNATTLTNAPVIAKVLTGYVSGAGTVAATDSILQAIQKLNGNDATNANLTGPITSVGNATAVGAQTGTGSTFVMQASPTLTTPKSSTTIGVGNETPSASGSGITFPATQDASTSANTLDDYEEGTWTPALTFGGGSTGLTYTTQSGRYTKIGRMAEIEMLVAVNSNGTSTGNAVFSGLPFTVTQNCAFASFLNGLAGISVGWSFVAVAATTEVRPFFGGGAGSVTQFTETNITDGSTSNCVGTYSI